MSAALRGSLLSFVSDAYRVYRFVGKSKANSESFQGNNSLEGRLFGHALGSVAAKALVQQVLSVDARHMAHPRPSSDARRAFGPHWQTKVCSKTNLKSALFDWTAAGVFGFISVGDFYGRHAPLPFSS